MDASTISAAYTGAKVALQTLRTIISTKADIAADSRVIEALEQLGKIQDTLFELRNRLAELQEENFALKDALRAREAWGTRASKYKLVTAPGGAVVYHCAEPPEHYACPRCFHEEKIHFLQDRGVMSGAYDCPGCGKSFDVGRPNYPPQRSLEPDY